MESTLASFVPFVVIFEGRSGSTFLVESLDSHPLILALREEFARIHTRVKDGKIPIEAQVRWLQEFWDKPRAGVNAVGFKTKHRDILDPDTFARVLKERNARIIQLARANRIKLVVSLLNGIHLHSETGDWNRYEGGHADPVEVPLDEFDHWLEKVDKRKDNCARYVRSLELPTLELVYEDLLAQPHAVYERVLQFLDVPQHALEAQTRKNTSDDLREAVLNFDALRARYEGTRYESMFD